MPVALEKTDRNLAEGTAFNPWRETSQPGIIPGPCIPSIAFEGYLGTSSYTMASQELPFKGSSRQETTNILVEIEETLKYIQNRYIMIPDVSDVRDYLIRYPDIITILAIACEAALERFAANAMVSLEVYHDPEIEDEYLTLYVRQQQYDADIMKKIKAVRAAYENMLVDKIGWLLLTTDFQPPR